MNSELESLAGAYTRLSHDVGGRINFACDLNNDDAFRIAEREKAHLDQAFFVLSFAALEKQITAIACARMPDADHGTAMRDAPFQQRWEAAVKVAAETLGTAVRWESQRAIVLSWYKIRSDIAHGRPPSQLADVPPVLELASEIAATLERVNAVLNAR